MRLTTVKSFLLVIIFILTASCTGESLTGHWKVQKVKLETHNNTFSIDLTKPDKVKKDMLTSFLQEPQNEGAKINTLEIKDDIEKTVTAYQKSGLTLMNNNKFEMASNGLLVLTSVPGWHFGDSLIGTWVNSNGLLTLSVDDNNQGYQWNFKIIQLTSKNLTLQQISQGAKGTTDFMDGPKNEIEFVRQ